MPDLLTDADVLAAMGKDPADFTDIQKAALTDIIEGMEADLRTYLKRPIVPTAFTDEEVSVDARGRVVLRNQPVLSVTTFTVDGDAIDATSYAVERWGLKDIFPGFLPSSLISPAPTLLVTYQAGLPGNDASTDFGRKARATIKRAAMRDFNQIVRQDLAGVARAGVEGTNLEFHGGVKAGAGGLTDDEKAQFSQWKRRISR